MSIKLQPLDRAKTYELVVRRIKDEIYAGRLRPGDRLPGERQLSELLNVSRPSVREAVRILQALEIVRSRPGTGADSGLIISTQPDRALSDLLRVHVALSSYSVGDVVRVRAALEEQAVRRLAECVGSTDTTPLQEILDRMSAPRLSRAAFHELDTEFHVQLARLTDNVLLGDLMQAMRDAVRRPMERAFENDSAWPERVQSLIDEHAEILAAVRAGDGDRAARLVRQHIDGFYDSVAPEADAG